MEYYLQRHDCQHLLFSKKVDRLQLNKVLLSDRGDKRLVVNVWRNHNIESLLPYLNLYSQYGNIGIEWKIGDYDDSFSFIDIQKADAEILWIDASRLLEKVDFDEWLRWLASRLQALRKLSTAPILLATWSDQTQKNELIRNVCERMVGVYFADMGSFCDDNNLELLDKRLKDLTGTLISNAAQVLIAREMACKWLPALILPPIKAVAVDLDNTLHNGVLGEDGIGGVILTEGHKILQRSLKNHQSNGVFLALVSKNEMSDVRELFMRRDDYLLRLEDFSSVQVSWGEKSDALKRIAEELRISPNSILFVDDNPGELIAVLQSLSNLKTVFAEEDAELTARVIDYYPGLWRWKVTEDDLKRVNDLKANNEREGLASQYADQDEYLKSLKAQLHYDLDSEVDIERITALSNKTNQFNLSLQRYSQAEIMRKMQDKGSSVISIKLSDRFSDSGIIAIIVAKKYLNILVIEEICMSCRAMGRGLENRIIFFAINSLISRHECECVEFLVKEGERNMPALTWIKNLQGSTSQAGRILVQSKNVPKILDDGLIGLTTSWS